jgi:hypothetical protein
MRLNITSIKERIVTGEALTAEERDFVLDCINEIADYAANLDLSKLESPPNYLGRIDAIWAFLSIDDGGEGVVAAPLQLRMASVPLIAADKARLDSLKPLARKLATVFKKPIRLVKFSTRENVETYQP